MTVGNSFLLHNVLNRRLHKSAAEAGGEDEKDRVDPDKVVRPGVGGALADFFAPFGGGGERAGRAAALADAAGRRVPVTLRHPGKTRLLYALLGGLAGATVGGMTGGGTGAGIGSAVGGGIGAIADTVARRAAMSKAKQQFRDTPVVEDDLPATSEYGTAMKFLSPLSGNWRAGNALARDAIRKRRPVFGGEGARGLTTTGEVLGRLGPIGGAVGAPLVLGGNIAQHLHANRRERILDGEDRDDVVI